MLTTVIALVSGRTFHAIRMLQDSQVLVWKLEECLVCASAAASESEAVSDGSRWQEGG
jgi:hypothetical protein